MPQPLPYRLTVEWPDPTWRPVDPESLGVHGASLLALKDVPVGEYVPSISIRGEVYDSKPLDLLALADGAVALLAGEVGSPVEVLQRLELGSPEAPALTQLLETSARLDAATEAHLDRGPLDLRRGQAFIAATDQERSEVWSVVVLTLTCTYAQMPDCAPALETLLRSFAPAPSAP